MGLLAKVGRFDWYIGFALSLHSLPACYAEQMLKGEQPSCDHEGQEYPKDAKPSDRRALSPWWHLLAPVPPPDC